MIVCDSLYTCVQLTADVRMGGVLDDDSEMLGGEKEMEAYRQSMAVKRAIQMQLGHRYGPRWSIPECELHQPFHPGQSFYHTSKNINTYVVASFSTHRLVLERLHDSL